MSKFPLAKRLALSCIIPLVLGAAFAPSYAAFPDAVAGKPLPSLAPVLERVTPSVVNISTRGRVQKRNLLMDDPFYARFYGDENKPNYKPTLSLGSGVVVDAREGLIVTNRHVVENVASLLVTLNDGREFTAKVVGSDPRVNIAVVQIAAKGLKEIVWADASELRVGDFTIAIGNPYGQGQSVSTGIVGAVGPAGKRGERLIQTDALINRSNSGGALINLRGELIGLNTAMVGPKNYDQGMGFAIPSKRVRELAIELLKARAAADASAAANTNSTAGVVEQGNGSLGITAQALTPELARVFGVASGFGVVIGRVEPGSPAESAGLRSGDVVTAIDGFKVRNLAELQSGMNRVNPGQQVRLDIIRNQRARNVTVTVAGNARSTSDPLTSNTTLSDQRAQNGRRYVQIDAVRSGSLAANSGLQAGDIILTIDEQNAVSSAQVEEIVARSGKVIALFIQRGRQTFNVKLKNVNR
jgi:S1-C subfamily serine protease